MVQLEVEVEEGVWKPGFVMIARTTLLIVIATVKRAVMIRKRSR